MDITRLPPAASITVDFNQHILPLFEASCFQCHGPEKPKSRFRLDQEEPALKGGRLGVDIIPGDSARSPLIHYVARLVEDLEMPPEGKGEPMTRDQISLLRAWIDQGAVYGSIEGPSGFEFSFAPSVQWITVDGAERKFREVTGMREGWNAGIEDFKWNQTLSKDAKLAMTGRASRDDFKVALQVEQRDLGFARFGWEQYRKYDDDHGGYHTGFAPPVRALDRNLHLDIGRAWADFGLTLPNWPKMVLGYEYQYKDGEQATLHWGPVRQAGAPPLTRNIFPAYRVLHERTHQIKFDLEHEFAGFRFEDRFRGEFYDLKSTRFDYTGVPLFPGNPTTRTIAEETTSFRGANAFRLEKQFNSWFFGSAGYLYSQLDADGAFGLNGALTMSDGLAITSGSLQSQQLVLDRDSHAFNLNALLAPWRGWTLTAGLQSEWTRQRSIGSSVEETLSPVAFTDPAEFRSNLSQATVTENAALRYTGIPFTTLFAEGRFRQETIGQFEELDSTATDFVRDTDTTRDSIDLRVGFNTSPWRLLTFGVTYRHWERDSDYDHLRDEATIAAATSYPAFILKQDTDTDQLEVRLSARPASWLRATLAYKLVASDYETTTLPGPGATSPGGRVLASNYDAHQADLNLTLTPWQRLYFSGTISYQPSRTESFANSVPSVTPYRGSQLNLLVSTTFVVNEKIDWFSYYQFSRADFGQSNYSAGLPLGVDYTYHQVHTGFSKRITKNTSARLQYGFYRYREPSIGGVNDFNAHGIFASVIIKL